MQSIAKKGKHNLTNFCNQPLKFGCQSCGNIADEKVHLDCRNAEFLVTNT